jgi:aminoglycoside phosphotransferase (APT) family kinase protein
MAVTAADEVKKITAWLEANIGGTVVHIARQPRWRPVWFADLERDGKRLELCVRGDRTDMRLIFPLDHEMRFQSLLHGHGIPAAKVYGWIDDPCAYVMDRVTGREDFTGATDAERRAVVNDYVQILARMHRLDLTPFVQAGIVRAARPEDSGRVGLRRYEEVFRAAKRHPEPLMEFCLGWLRRHPPDSKGREAPIVWDSGQFHHQHGRVTAVLDLELAHIGDPMMDLAGWRIRDTVLGYGDFTQLYRDYAALTGAPVDLDAIRIHLIAFTLTNQLAFAAALRNPPPESDLMMNLRWCGETNLFATEALAEYLDIDLPPVDMPPPRSSSAAAGYEHLVRSLRLLETDDEFVRYRARMAFRLSRYLQRHDEIGAAVTDADLVDLHQLLGKRPATWQDGEAELERFVLADADQGRHDETLIRLLHRRNLRAQMLLGPPGSAMTRHIPMQRFPR